MTAPCEHVGPSELTVEEATRLSEGTCPSCRMTAVRDEDWAECPCCGNAWRLDSDYLYIRVSREKAVIAR